MSFPVFRQAAVLPLACTAAASAHDYPLPDTVVIDGVRIGSATTGAAAYDLRHGRHLLDVSTRTDRSEYGAKTTGAADYGYEFTQDLRATASFGTSFRAPTFNELFYPGYGLVSNQPERGRNAEAGVPYRVAGADLQASGRRFDDAANAHPLGGYGLLNLYTSWHMTRDWSLLVRVDNAAAKSYELARNYGTAGRTWFAGIRYGSR